MLPLMGQRKTLLVSVNRLHPPTVSETTSALLSAVTCSWPLRGSLCVAAALGDTQKGCSGRLLCYCESFWHVCNQNGEGKSERRPDRPSPRRAREGLGHISSLLPEVGFLRLQTSCFYGLDPFKATAPWIRPSPLTVASKPLEKCDKVTVKHQAKQK